MILLDWLRRRRKSRSRKVRRSNTNIATYYEKARWAELPDARSAPVEISLGLLDALHVRWVLLLRQLKTDDWLRTYSHPELRREVTLDEVLAMYAWHGEHHVAHITTLRHRQGWN